MTDTSGSLAPTDRSDRRRTALFLLCAAQLMLVLDLTAVNVALPTIARELDLSGAQAAGAITAYVVAFGGLMLLGGRLADAWGRRRTLLTGLAVFTTSSLACGTATSAEALLAGRIYQGVGAALMSPAALASVTALYRDQQRLRALGVWAAVGAGGFVGGLVLSGLITSGPGWRWIFLVNLPIGVLLAVILPRCLPATPGTREPIDFAGAGLSTVALGALIYGLSVLGDRSGALVRPAVAFGAAGVLGALFLIVEHRRSHPMLSLAVARRPPVLGGLGVMLVTSAGLLSIFFLASMYAQQVLHLSAFATGLVFLPSAVTTMAAAHLAGPLIGEYGGRAVAVGGFVITSAGALVLSQLTAESSLSSMVIPGLVLTSLGLGPAILVATSTTLARIDDAEAGIASGIVNTGHEIGGALGLGLLTAWLGSSLTSSGVDGYADGFFAITVGAVAAALLALFVVPAVRPDPAHLTHGH